MQWRDWLLKGRFRELCKENIGEESLSARGASEIALERR